VVFSLGVEVDLEAVERYRVPQAVLDSLRDAPSGSVAGVAGVREPPRVINTIVYPDGAAVHMMNSSVGYGYFSEGHATAYIEGVTLRCEKRLCGSHFLKCVRTKRAIAKTGSGQT
jgi:hypothetical protein